MAGRRLLGFSIQSVKSGLDTSKASLIRERGRPMENGALQTNTASTSSPNGPTLQRLGARSGRTACRKEQSFADTTGTVVSTQNGKAPFWLTSHEDLTTPDSSSVSYGWLLYTEPTYRPWRTDEVPLGAWMREKNGGLPSLIVGVTSTNLGRGHGDWINFPYSMEHYEHSTDNGRTWLPCGVLDTP